eukprot:m.20085 g.20085  ORF g.20085 m.20085 type:complete len:414 (+) comp6079_c1_seq1:177-1418(+)
MGIFDKKKQRKPSSGSLSSLLSLPDHTASWTNADGTARSITPTSPTLSIPSSPGARSRGKSPAPPTLAPPTLDAMLLGLDDDLDLFDPVDPRLPRPSLREEPSDDEDDSPTKPDFSLRRPSANLGILAQRLNQSLSHEPSERKKATAVASRAQAIAEATRPVSFIMERQQSEAQSREPELDTAAILAAAERAMAAIHTGPTALPSSPATTPAAPSPARPTSLHAEQVVGLEDGDGSFGFGFGLLRDSVESFESLEADAIGGFGRSVSSSSSPMRPTERWQTQSAGHTPSSTPPPKKRTGVPLRRHVTAPAGQSALEARKAQGRSFNILEHQKRLHEQSERGSVADLGVLLADIQSKVEFEKSVIASRKLLRDQRQQVREQKRKSNPNGTKATPRQDLPKVKIRDESSYGFNID